MDANNEMRLLLRFYKDISENVERLKSKFEISSREKSNEYAIKIKGNHVWISIIGSAKRYWSPHLHLELEAKNEKETHIRGLFGPDQALWTLFMFLHFIIAGIFVIFCGIAYSNYVLKLSTTFDFVVMVLMIVVWFLLYFIAKQIRKNSNEQMNRLEGKFLEILES
jgi:H+/Cl- antiporter ClcA